MGFFSWECEVCEHSIRSVHAVVRGGGDAWMANAVAILSNGTILEGTYDGYGNVDGIQVPTLGSDEPTFYHQDCWESVGRPMEYRGPSRHARDQGYFIDPGYNPSPQEARKNPPPTEEEV